jgi:hypothetical protein
MINSIAKTSRARVIAAKQRADRWPRHTSQRNGLHALGVGDDRICVGLG